MHQSSEQNKYIIRLLLHSKLPQTKKRVPCSSSSSAARTRAAKAAAIYTERRRAALKRILQLVRRRARRLHPRAKSVKVKSREKTQRRVLRDLSKRKSKYGA
jgi:hypothetical protein